MMRFSSFSIISLIMGSHRSISVDRKEVELHGTVKRGFYDKKKESAVKRESGWEEM